jgi:hypothetical protein
MFIIQATVLAQNEELKGQLYAKESSHWNAEKEYSNHNEYQLPLASLTG